jgi:hypothetical protein
VLVLDLLGFCHQKECMILGFQALLFRRQDEIYPHAWGFFQRT